MIEQIAESIKEYFDTNDWYDNVYETNLENLCNDIRKELWI